MAEINSPDPSHKHQIIHWNPAQEKPSEESGTTLRGWQRLALGLVGLLVVGIIGLAAISVWRHHAGSRVSASGAVSVAAAPMATNTAVFYPNYSFASRSKAEFARETAAKALEEYRKMPDTHPVLLQRLVLIEQQFQIGDRLLTASDYGQALAQFDRVNASLADYGKTIHDKQEARAAYDNFLANMDDYQKGKTLAPKDYEDAFTAASEARQFLEQGSFSAAKLKMADANHYLQKISDAVARYITDSMNAGRLALSSGDKAKAIASFQQVLKFRPNNESAQKGLARAQTIDKVHALLADAGKLEKSGDLPGAEAKFAEALKTDSLSATAQEGKSRVASEIKARAFSKAIKQAKAAEAKKDWPAAITAYEAAVKVYPNRDDVKKALEVARKNDHTTKVHNLLAKAYHYEDDHHWEEARKAYFATLDLEPNLQAAKDGLTRTGHALRTLLLYDKLLSFSSDLAKQADFQGAIRNFNQAMNIKPDYLPLTDNQVSLKNFLVSQSKPVTIPFVSDGRTWVTIANFKLLGKFSTVSVPMLPGNYDILGRRKGFEDIHLILQVRQGHNPPTVTVICNQRMRND